jgi:hypothetical protein
VTVRRIYQSVQQLLASAIFRAPRPANPQARLRAAQQAFDEFDKAVVLPLIGSEGGLPANMSFVDVAKAIPDDAIRRRYCALATEMLNANIELYDGDAAFSTATRGWRRMSGELARASDGTDGGPSAALR